MARQVKPEQYAARRREILDAARELTGDKGYARMTIEDVLAKTRMSRGALYHYFGSKRALLEGIVETIGQDAVRGLQAVVDDANLGAIDKLHAYFRTEGAAQRPGGDNNALLRQRLAQESMRTTAPMLEAIIRQGLDEGVFDTDYPGEAASIITDIGLHLTSVPAAYFQAVERILGASAGTLAPGASTATSGAACAPERASNQ
jgi:AcrR family transcriptional regulator